MTIINFYRVLSIVASVKPDKSSTETKKLMEAPTVVISCEENTVLNITLGDYCQIYGTTYFVNTFPVIEKISSINYRYTITVESNQSIIKKTRFLGLGADNQLSTLDFPLTAKPFQFMDLLLRNLTRNTETGQPWIIGAVIDGPAQNIMFDNLDCLEAVKKIAEAYNTEFYIDGITIHLARKERQTGHVFQYGKGKGLYKITRTQLQVPVITRLYAQGGSTNIPSGYRNGSTRLLPPRVANENVVSNVSVITFPPIIGGDGLYSYSFRFTRPLNTSVTSVVINYRPAGSTTWTATGNQGGNSAQLRLGPPPMEFYFSTLANGQHYDTPIFIVSSIGSMSAVFPATTNFYLERNIDLYPKNEATLILDDIYPNRIGTVTGIDSTNPFKFSDNNIGFNVNNQLIGDLKPKVLFKSGQLSDYSFNIVSVTAGGDFLLELNNNEQAVKVPSTLMCPAVGDTYVLVDIIMPQSYIDDAEQRLYQQAATYLEKNSVPQFNYTIECDPLYFRDNQIELLDGDVVMILDTDLQASIAQRVIRVSRPIIDQEVNRYAFTVEVGEIPPKNKIEELLSSTRSVADFDLRIRRTFAGNRFLDQTPDWQLTRGTLIRNIRVGGG